MDDQDRILYIIYRSGEKGNNLTARDRGEVDLGDIVQTLYHQHKINFDLIIEKDGKVNEKQLNKSLKNLEKVNFIKDRDILHGDGSLSIIYDGHITTELGKEYIKSELDGKHFTKKIDENLGELLSYFNG